MCKGPQAKGTMGLRSRSPVLLELLLLEREVGGKLWKETWPELCAGSDRAIGALDFNRALGSFNKELRL